MGPTWIAELPVVLAEGTERTPLRIAVAAPEDMNGHAACRVQFERTHTIFGEDRMQALMLALRFLGMQAHILRERGVRMLGESGEDLPLDAYFGPLLAAPPEPPK